MRMQKIKESLASTLDIAGRGRAKYSTIRERIQDAARVDGIHLCQLIAAMIIASIGLNTDSTEAIIGAMLICPLMGSVLELAYGVAVMDMRAARRALAGLGLQCAICLVTSTLYFVFSPLETRTAALVTNANATIWDVIIALVGGLAGGLGLSRSKEPETLVSGVAVATALMPPLCASGYGIARGSAVLAFSAFYEFLTNVVFIAFGATCVFVWLHVPLVGDLDGDGRENEEERAEAQRESRPLRHKLMIALLVFALPCLYISSQVVKDSVVQQDAQIKVVDAYDTALVTQELEVICPGFVEYGVAIEDTADDEDGQVRQLVVARVRTRSELDAISKKEIEGIIRVHVKDLDEIRFEVGEQE